jgi:glycosyltransferase involved in cell wall biosynthesis
MGILIFIPMYNNERQIPRVLARFTPEIQQLFSADGGRILIVDNGSRDGSHAAAIEGLKKLDRIPGTLVKNVRNVNLGGSHKTAFAWAIEQGYSHIVVLHGDDQADIADLAPLVRAGEHDRRDQLLGSRFMRGSRLVGYSFVRTWGNRLYNLLFSLCSGAWLTDLGSGLNMYKTSYVADRFYLNYPNALTFNYHMVLAGVMRGARTRFFPISWREEDQRSNVKLVRQGLRTLLIPVKYLLNRNAWQHADYTGTPNAQYRCEVLFESR